MTQETWRLDAACRGMDPAIFYPERGEPTAPAKAVCNDCPVAADCLTYALVNLEKAGIWGGCSERERRSLRGRMRREGGVDRIIAERRDRTVEARRLRASAVGASDFAERRAIP